MMLHSQVLQIPAGADSATEIPISTIQGARPGPVLALIAGNHGYEYPPILALQKILKLIDAADLSGSLILVHTANMPSFLGRTVYFSPVDGKNLNRVYPGRQDGSVSERIAYAITTQVIEKADLVLDLHCGDGNEWLRPYVYQTITGNAPIDQSLGRLALAFGIDHILLDRNRPTDPAKSLYCSTTAITRGKPALTIESGGLGGCEPESVDRIVHGIQGVMREWQMTESGPAPIARPVYLDPSAVVTSPATGILYPLVAPDQVVEPGAILARVTDFFGQTIAEISAPIGGVVLYVVATPPINRGQPVACIGTRVELGAPVRATANS
jgi:predicted deacylase